MVEYYLPYELWNFLQSPAQNQLKAAAEGEEYFSQTLLEYIKATFLSQQQVFMRPFYPVREYMSLLEAVSDASTMCYMKQVYGHHEIQLKSMSDSVAAVPGPGCLK